MQKRTALSHFYEPTRIRAGSSTEKKQQRERKREKLSTMESLKPGSVQAFLVVYRFRTSHYTTPGEALLSFLRSPRSLTAASSQAEELPSPNESSTRAAKLPRRLAGFFVVRVTAWGRTLATGYTSVSDTW